MNEYDVLKAYSSEIQAEHVLISHRMSWYATSQAFLFAAYAAGGRGNDLKWVLLIGMPVVGICLSILAFKSIMAAITVQNDLIDNQTQFIASMKQKLNSRLQRHDSSNGTADQGQQARSNRRDTEAIENNSSQDDQIQDVQQSNDQLKKSVDDLKQIGEIHKTESFLDVHLVDEYAKIACAGRPTKMKAHEIAMWTPRLIPIIFSSMWAIAFLWSLFLFFMNAGLHWEKIQPLFT
jgi:hypothetical protein